MESGLTVSNKTTTNDFFIPLAIQKKSPAYSVDKFLTMHSSQTHCVIELDNVDAFLKAQKIEAVKKISSEKDLPVKEKTDDDKKEKDKEETKKDNKAYVVAYPTYLSFSANGRRWIDYRDKKLLYVKRGQDVKKSDDYKRVMFRLEKGRHARPLNDLHLLKGMTSASDYKTHGPFLEKDEHYKELLKHKKEQKQFVVVEADYGSGKTRFLERLEELSQIPQRGAYTFLIKIELKSLKPEDNKKSLDGFLCDFLFLQGKDKVTKEILKFDIKQGNVLLLLDGWDELLGHQRSACEDILKVLLGYDNVIITTRPSHASSLTRFATLRLKPQKFDDEKRNQFIEKYFKGKKAFIPHAKSAAERALSIEGLSEVIGVPLMTKLVCKVVEVDKEALSKKPFTLSDLYKQFVRAAFLKFHMVKNKTPLSRLKKGDRLDRFSYCEIDYLEKLAFSQLFPSHKETVNLPSPSKSQREDLLSLGFIKNQYSIGKQVGQNLKFDHQSVLEYFCALYFAKSLAERKTAIENVLFENRYNVKYGVVWEFLSGILASGAIAFHNTKEEKIRFGAIINKEPRDRLGIAANKLIKRCSLGVELKRQKEVPQFSDKAANVQLYGPPQFPSKIKPEGLADLLSQGKGHKDDQGFLEEIKKICGNQDKNNLAFVVNRIEGSGKLKVESPISNQFVDYIFKELGARRDYWDIDAGFSCVVILREHFNKTIADYLIELCSDKDDTRFQYIDVWRLMHELSANPPSKEKSPMFLRHFLTMLSAVYKSIYQEFKDEAFGRAMLFYQKVSDAYPKDLVVKTAIDIFDEFCADFVFNFDKLLFLVLLFINFLQENEIALVMLPDNRSIQLFGLNVSSKKIDCGKGFFRFLEIIIAQLEKPREEREERKRSVDERTYHGWFSKNKKSLLPSILRDPTFRVEGVVTAWTWMSFLFSDYSPDFYSCFQEIERGIYTDNIRKTEDKVKENKFIEKARKLINKKDKAFKGIALLKLLGSDLLVSEMKNIQNEGGWWNIDAVIPAAGCLGRFFNRSTYEHIEQFFQEDNYRYGYLFDALLQLSKGKLIEQEPIKYVLLFYNGLHQSPFLKWENTAKNKYASVPKNIKTNFDSKALYAAYAEVEEKLHKDVKKSLTEVIENAKPSNRKRKLPGSRKGEAPLAKKREIEDQKSGGKKRKSPPKQADAMKKVGIHAKKRKRLETPEIASDGEEANPSPKPSDVPKKQ